MENSEATNTPAEQPEGAEAAAPAGAAPTAPAGAAAPAGADAAPGACPPYPPYSYGDPAYAPQPQPPYQPPYQAPQPSQPYAPYPGCGPYVPYGYAPYDPYTPYGYAPYPYTSVPYGAFPPYPAYGYAPAPAPIPASEPEPESPFWHSLKGVLSVVGVFAAVLGIQFVAVMLVMIVVIAMGGASTNIYEWILGDGLLVVEVVVQVVWLVAVVPWWLHVRKRGIGLFRDKAKEDAEDPLNIAWRVLGIIMLGFGAQIAVALVLNLVLPLFPDVMSSYESLMEDSGLAGDSLLTLLSAVVLAPLVEEITFRGLTMQFSLRAMCHQWTGRLTKEGLMRLNITPAQFWAANALQAASFGFMHMNIVQGLYAFVLGLVLGWVFWRTGKLRWCIGLHVAFNFSGYVLDGMYVALGGLGFVGLLIEILVAIALVVGGILLFRRFTKPTALGE